MMTAQREMFSPGRDSTGSINATSPTKTLKRGSKTSYSELRDLFSEGVDLATEDDWGFEDDAIGQKQQEFTTNFASKMQDKLTEMETRLAENRRRETLTENEKLMEIARTQSREGQDDDTVLSASVLAEQFTKTAILKALPEILANLELTSGDQLDETDVMFYLPEKDNTDNDSTIITAQEFINAMSAAVDEYENSRVFTGRRAPRKSYADLVGADDDFLLPVIPGYCGSLNRATVTRLVLEGEPMDFVIFKNEDGKFELCINMPDENGYDVTMRPINRTDTRVWVEGMEVFEKMEDLIGHLQQTGYTDVNNDNETTSTKLNSGLEIQDILTELTHAVHGVPWPINIPRDEYFDGVVIDIKSHPEYYTEVHSNVHSLMQQLEHATKVFAPITYCGSVGLKKSLRKLDTSDKLRVSREAIRMVKSAIKLRKKNLDESIMSVMTMSADPDEVSLFERHLDSDDLDVFNDMAAMSVSTHGGIRVIDLNHAEQPELFCDPFDSISMLTGGIGNSFTYFCYVTRQPTGSRVCRVYKSAKQSAAIIDQLGEFALDRFLAMKEDMDQANVMANVAAQAQVYVTTKITGKLPTDPLPMKYSFPPAYDEAEEEFELEPLDKKILEKKLKEWLKDPSGPPPTSSNLQPFNRKNNVSAALEDRLEIIKFQVLRDWFQQNPDATDDILRELVEFSDQLIEAELKDYEEHVEVIKKEQLQTTDEMDLKSDAILERFQTMISNSMPGQQVVNDADVVNDSMLSDDEDDEFGFPYLELQAGSLAARLEEKTEAFGFRETALRGFIENKIRASGGSLEKIQEPSVTGADIPEEGKWGFVDPSQYIPRGFTTKRVFVQKGANGFGLKLRVSDNKVFVQAITPESPVNTALRAHASTVVAARILQVNGEYVTTKEACVQQLKAKPSGAEITFLFADNVESSATSGAAGGSAALLGSLNVFVPRGETGYGVGMADINGQVVLRKAKPGSALENVLGKHIDGIVIVKIDGQVVQTKAKAIELLKASVNGVRLDVRLPSTPKTAKTATPSAHVRTVTLTRSAVGYGLTFSRQNDKMVIGKVKPNTPAAQSKLEQGSVLVTINGRETASMTKTEIMSLIQASKETLELGVGLGAGGGAQQQQQQQQQQQKQQRLSANAQPQSKPPKKKSDPNGTQKGSAKNLSGAMKPREETASLKKKKGKKTTTSLRANTHSDEPRYATVNNTSNSSSTRDPIYDAPPNSSTSGAKCAYTAGDGRGCKQPAATPSQNCSHHTCGMSGCNGSKSSKTTYCNKHSGTPSATPGATPSQSESTPAWLSKCTRPEAEQLLKSIGTPGASLGRTSSNATSGIVLSMLLESNRITHFQVNEENSKFFVPAGAGNEKIMFDSADELVQHFSKKENRLGPHNISMIEIPSQFRA